MRRCLPVLLFGLIAQPASAQIDAYAAESVSALFCQNHDEPWLGALEPFLSPDLLAAAHAAIETSDAWAVAYPDEKPPLGDGIPWKSWPDFADDCEADEPLYMMDEASVRITYRFSDAPDADYTDRLALVLIDGNWLIDDVRYASSEDSLRAILDEIAAQPVQ